MKKEFRTIITLIISACLAFGLAACGSNADKQQDNPDTSATGSLDPDVPEKDESELLEEELQTTEEKILVAYFSATGTTKEAAEKIAALTNADLYEIIPAEPYSAEDLNYNDDQSRASLEMNDQDARPEIGREMISLDDYSTLYIGYPIWWGSAPRIMSTFVESYDFDGIEVIPFCTSGSSDIGSSAEQLAEQAGGGTWAAGRRFGGGAADADLQEWIDSLP